MRHMCTPHVYVFLLFFIFNCIHFWVNNVEIIFLEQHYGAKSTKYHVAFKIRCLRTLLSEINNLITSGHLKMIK